MQLQLQHATARRPLTASLQPRVVMCSRHLESQQPQSCELSLGCTASRQRLLRARAAVLHANNAVFHRMCSAEPNISLCLSAAHYQANKGSLLSELLQRLCSSMHPGYKPAITNQEPMHFALAEQLLIGQPPIQHTSGDQAHGTHSHANYAVPVCECGLHALQCSCNLIQTEGDTCKTHDNVAHTASLIPSTHTSTSTSESDPRPESNRMHLHTADVSDQALP
jgi:hypothetical protein